MLIIQMLWKILKIKNLLSYQYVFVSFADHIYNVCSYTPDFKLILPKVFQWSFHRLNFLNFSTSVNDFTFTDMINITRVYGYFSTFLSEDTRCYFVPKPMYAQRLEKMICFRHINNSRLAFFLFCEYKLQDLWPATDINFLFLLVLYLEFYWW